MPAESNGAHRKRSTPHPRVGSTLHWPEIAAGKVVLALAAPAVATGMLAELTDFGMLLARERGLPLTPQVIAKTTWEMIEPTSVRPTKDHKPIREKPEALAHLTIAAEALVAQRLSILQNVGI